MAYWTQGQALAWQRKFAPKASNGGKQIRTRNYEHLLLGVFSCHACGTVLVSAGRHGYTCPRSKATCASPQTVPDHAAWRFLRELLPELLTEVKDAINARSHEMEAQAQGVQLALDKLRQDRRLAQEKLDGTMEDWYGDEAEAKRVPANIKARMQELSDMIEALDAEIAEATAQQEEENPARDKLAGLDDIDELLHLFDTDFTEAQKAAVYRALVAEVKIRGKGGGPYRQFELIRPYRPVLARTLFSGRCPRSSRRSRFA